MNVATEQYFIHSFHFITKNILYTPAQKRLKKKKKDGLQLTSPLSRYVSQNILFPKGNYASQTSKIEIK